MKRIKKALKVIFIVVLAGGIITAGGYFYFKMHNARYDAQLTSTVTLPVTIKRNSNGVPHIKVFSAEDLFFALGYLHAQDRFIYMEYFRAIARADLTSLGGNRGKELDRLSMLLGVREKAEKMLKGLNQQSRSYISAYVAGINYIMDQAMYKNQLPYAWDVQDVLAVHILKEWSQAFLNNRELVVRLPDELKNMKFRFLREIVSPDMIYFYNDEEKNSVELLKRLKQLVQSSIGSFNRGFAFTIPAYRTKERKMLSGFSYSDRLSQYPAWYPVIVSLNDADFTVVTHAGLPYLFSGDSANFTFYNFNLNCDSQDLIQVRVKLESGIPYYFSQGRWKNFMPVDGSVFNSYKDMSKPVPLYRAEDALVVNDIFSDCTYGSSVLVIKSLFLDHGYVDALLNIPFAGSVQEAVRAAKQGMSPPRVHLFADDRQAVKVYAGAVPLRKNSRRVVQRSIPSWYGYSSLSRYTASGNRSYVIGSSFSNGAPYVIKKNILNNAIREKKLLSLISTRKALTVPDVQKIVNDTHSALAEEFTPVFLSMLQSSPITSARLTRMYFHEWEYGMDAHAVAPTIFQKLLLNFIDNTLGDELGEDVDLLMEQHIYIARDFFETVKTGLNPCFDDVTTYGIETRDTIFDRTFLDTMRDLNREKGPLMDTWEWGNLSRGHFTIPFTGKSLISRIIYTIEDRPLFGGCSTVYYTAANRDLRPVETSSLRGFYYHGKVMIKMDFAYSINPLSEFYYGRINALAIDTSEQFHDVYTTVVRPDH